MKAALGTKDQWVWKQEEWTEEGDWLLEKYTWAVLLFIPWGSNARFLMVSVFNLKSERPTSEKGNAWAGGRRLVSLLWTGLNQLTGWSVSHELSIFIAVASSAMGSPCHLLLWHSDFRWQQRKKYALGLGRISKWSWHGLWSQKLEISPPENKTEDSNQEVPELSKRYRMFCCFPSLEI